MKIHELVGAEEKRVLVACETSQTVQKAFEARGFDAWSNDILPSDKPSNRHIQCDVREILDDDWDLIIVAHPPCTTLTLSGVRWLFEDCKKGTAAQRWEDLREGTELFADCLKAPAKHVAVENPIMHKHAKKMIREHGIPDFDKATQIVQPWHFGEEAFKATGLHLQNLPTLVPTDKLNPPKKKEEPQRHKEWSFIHMASPSADRWKLRSKTFDGIAAGMADQWGRHIINHNPDLEL